MTPDVLIEATTTAHRERDADGRIRFHPAWWDLSQVDRRVAFNATTELRKLEAAADPDGLSSTARAVLDRIRGA